MLDSSDRERDQVVDKRFKLRVEIHVSVGLSKRGMAAPSAGIVLADTIEGEVRNRRHVPGSVLAFENELQTRHGAGRSVVRQAIRILVQRGVVYTRRGKGGGLIVAEPDPQSASRALSIVLESQLTSLSDVSSVVMATDNHLFSNCTPRVSLSRCKELRTLMKHLDSLSPAEFLRVGAHRQAQTAIRKAFGDPAASLAHQMCMECGIDLIPYSVSVAGERERGEFWELMLQMVEALVAGNVPLMFELRLRLRQLFEANWSSLSSADRQREREMARLDDVSSSEEQSGETGADRLTREILREIRALGWEPGKRIGGTEDLVRRYDASPGVLRQAVRMLEEYSAVQMKRGRQGGLLITTPNEARAIRRAVGYLRTAGIRAGDVHLFLIQLLLEGMHSSTAGSSPQALAQLQEAIKRDRSSRRRPQSDVVRNLYLAIAQLPNNPAVELFVRVLLACLPKSILERASSTASMRHLDEMFQCIVAQDIPGARRAFLQYGTLSAVGKE